MPEGHRPKPVSRGFFRDIKYLLHQSEQSIFVIKVTWSVEATLTDVEMVQEQSELQKKQIKEMLKSNARRSLRGVGVISGDHNTTVWHFPHQKLKEFPFRPHQGNQLSEIDRENSGQVL